MGKPNPRIIDMAGKTVGDWTVLEKAGNRKGGLALWLCRCSCGVERAVGGSDLRNGKSKNCGCKSQSRLGEANRTHSATSARATPTMRRLYRVWQNMKQRCCCEDNPSYANYGGRGISICDEWLDFVPFYDWAILNGYSEDLTIERVDNHGNYCPENCIWADVTTQARNKRNTLRLPNGESAAALAEANGISASVVVNRVLAGGWSIEDAATLPIGTYINKRERDEFGRFKKEPHKWRR